MRHYVWDAEGTRIPVSNHFRDLGCHLCLDNTGAGTTTSDRLRRATASVKKLRYLPLPKEDKIKVVQSNILPAALCGIEATSGNKALVGELQAAIVDAIGPRSVRRAQMGVFELQRDGREMDPEVVQLVRRVALLRRELTKFPEIQGNVRLIIKRYAEKRKAKKDCAERGSADCAVAGASQDCPMPEAISREDVEDYEAQQELQTCGPIGFLMDELKRIGARLTDALHIESVGAQSSSIQDLPWQRLKDEVEVWARRARTAKAASSREAYSALTEVDGVAIKAAVSKRTQKEMNIIAHSASLAAWTDRKSVV